MELPESIDGSKWQVIDFISDLHLQISEPSTANAWFFYMDSIANETDALFILGDWFEVWIGDDNDDPFLNLCAAVVRKRAIQTKKPCKIFVMHGNRDFLLGNDFIHRCQATLIADPFKLFLNNSPLLLTHGDTLCTSDVNYINFRKTVRSPNWQQLFLSQSLEKRREQAHQMRAISKSLHTTQSRHIDIDTQLAEQWLNHYGCSTLIHGHTHQPSSSKMSNHTTRHVLSDWDANATPARLEILRFTQNKGFQRIDLKGKN